MALPMTEKRGPVMAVTNAFGFGGTNGSMSLGIYLG